MDFQKIREVIKLFDESKANFLELEDDGFYLKLQEKQEKIYSNVQNIPVPAQVPAVVPDTVQTNQSEKNNTTETSDSENYHTIKSPMVGTFYKAPSPDSEPFVEVGQSISMGDTLCIIEAMKLMNEIESDVKGKIVKFLVENAEPVEFNQPLFLIKPE